MLPNISKLLCRRILKPTSIHTHMKSTPPAPAHNGPPIIISRYVHSSCQKKAICSNYIICCLRTFAGYASPWFVLRKLGIPCRYIIKFRRQMKRFSYPWLVYSIPIALAMGTGDILAQLYVDQYKMQQIKDSKGRVKEVKIKHNQTIHDLDRNRTAKFMLFGLIILGPVISKWNALTRKKLCYNTPQKFIIKKLTLNTFVLAPVLIFVGITSWDYHQVYHNYPKLVPVWEKRLKKPFLEIFQFNLMTRPIMDLVICMLVPSCLRKFVRRPYEILFFAFVSTVLMKHKLGEKWKPAPVIPVKRSIWGRRKKK